MEDPVGEIPDVIHGLVTSSSVTTQRTTLEYYFLPDARFDHPLCRVDSFAYPLFSRSFIMGTYRWYKLLSPVIELDVESIAFDEPHGRLYVSATQIFTYWFFPFIRIPTTLVVVLELQKMQRRRATRVQDESSSEHSSDGPQQPDGGSGDESGGEDERWYIKSQTDLYQFEQWIGFIPFVGLLARAVVLFLKRLAGWSCLVFATAILWFGLAVGQRGSRTTARNSIRRKDNALQFVTNIQRRIMGNVQEKWRK